MNDALPMSLLDSCEIGIDDAGEDLDVGHQIRQRRFEFTNADDLDLRSATR
jgi:hypothetical protein